MATCLKCGKDNLEWIKAKGKWELYEAETGDLHSLVCVLTKDEYHSRASNQIPISPACSHGILKTHACDDCDNKRRGDFI